MNITEKQAREAAENIIGYPKDGCECKSCRDVALLSTLITRHFVMEKALKEIADYSNSGVYTYNTARNMVDIAQKALAGKELVEAGFEREDMGSNPVRGTNIKGDV